MTSEIRMLLAAQPFIPFTIHMADGNLLRVPTMDHAAVSPQGGRILVFADDDTSHIVSPHLIARVTVDKQTAPA